MNLPFIKLEPAYRDYVWGGDRLRPGHNPTAEAWMVWEENRIEGGPLRGISLAECASRYGGDLLGSRAVSRTGTRFPLLIKLLDCAQWLSLQVHPDDDLAAELEGPGQYGKTEAWHILEADAGARLIAGLLPGTPSGIVADSIRTGRIIDHVLYVSVSKGDTVFMPAGLLHALGPGLLVYEVQQTSDWTYRVYDWDRPQTETRRLHIEKSIRATKPGITSPVVPPPAAGDGLRHVLTSCEYFTLELLAAEKQAIGLETRGESFHAVTLIEGGAVLQAGPLRVELDRYQTVVVPARIGGYEFLPMGACRALKASV